MTAPRLPFLAGRVLRADPYLSTRSRDHAPTIPKRDADAHRELLMRQLEQVWRDVAKRGFDDRDPAARNEIIAIKPKEGEDLPAESYGDARYGMRVISKDEVSGVVLIDASRPDLPHLRQKIDAYGDVTKASEKTGERRGAASLNPIEQVHIATLDELMGPRLMSAVQAGTLTETENRWFEIACRGGRRERTLHTETSRQQVRRFLEKLNRPTRVPEFLATQQIVFFLRLSLSEVRQLIATTDCVYELDLVSPDVRDWLHFTQPTLPTPDFLDFSLTPPRAEAVSVVLLDTGITSAHPMLAKAVLHAASVVPEDSSPADVHGHGTWMAGVALYDDVGALVDANAAFAAHWLESVKVLRQDRTGSAADDRRDIWPVLFEQAIESVELQGARARVFAMAITAPHDNPGSATTWSQAVDQLAYNDGRGRLICIATGNSDILDPAIAQAYPQLHLTQLLEDPAQSVNALTVGAYTAKVVLPPDESYASLRPLAPAGGVGPSTRSGCDGAPVKPDVVFEGGNFVFDNDRAYGSEPTLSTLTTGRDFLRAPLAIHQDTSAATAHAARFVAQVWAASPNLRPETVRGLIVHSARWTERMMRQLPNIDERLRLCGYGVPDLSLATECLHSRATIIVEDEMPNLIVEEDEEGEEKRKRLVKLVRMPIPEAILLAAPDEIVELTVTLSFFAEPSTFRRREMLGLRLGWDMQGPGENEAQFLQRLNLVDRRDARKSDSYSPGQGYKQWDLRTQRRSRGTVQSDRLEIAASLLAESKLIAIYPILGWWDDRAETKEESLPFSLIVTLQVPNADIYTPIAQALQAEVELPAT
jgi:hypothetical protein